MTNLNDNSEFDDFEDEDERELESDALLDGLQEKAKSFADSIQPMFNELVDFNLGTNYMKQRSFGAKFELRLQERLKQIQSKQETKLIQGS